MGQKRIYTNDREAHLMRYGDPHFRARYMLSNARQRATKGSLPFDLDREWLKEKLCGSCEVTRLPFDLNIRSRGKGHHSPWSPSLDRKDPDLGYTKDNCRMVVWMYNAAKHVSSDEDVLKMTKALWQQTP